jgi:hypothetical protein
MALNATQRWLQQVLGPVSRGLLGVVLCLQLRLISSASIPTGTRSMST